jgi:hypothetical protein
MQPSTTDVVVTTTTPLYDRGEWGRWTDADKDCQDGRQEVLAAESTEPVTWDERGCKVLSGAWTCPLTGERFTDPSKLDIDHVVPLREAHDSGGHAWPKERKRAYFNDLGNPDHLMATSASANRSKGSRQPHEWMPTRNQCNYLRAWVGVKQNWDLEIDCEEARQLAQLLAKHCD